MPETAQPAPEPNEKKSRGLGSYVVWAFVAVMVYVLSFGPVVLACRYLNGSHRIITIAYRPWFHLYAAKTPLHKPLGLYMHLWDPKNWDKNGEWSWNFPEA